MMIIKNQHFQSTLLYHKKEYSRYAFDNVENSEPPLNGHLIINISWCYFVVFVLQAGAWPIGQSNLPSFAIPQQLETSVRRVGVGFVWCSIYIRNTYIQTQAVFNESFTRF